MTDEYVEARVEGRPITNRDVRKMCSIIWPGKPITPLMRQLAIEAYAHAWSIQGDKPK